MKDPREEVLKLDGVDRKVLFWMKEHSPKAVKSWIEYIAVTYRKTKSVTIDVPKLFREIEAR